MNIKHLTLNNEQPYTVVSKPFQQNLQISSHSILTNRDYCLLSPCLLSRKLDSLDYRSLSTMLKSARRINPMWIRGGLGQELSLAAGQASPPNPCHRLQITL